VLDEAGGAAREANKASTAFDVTGGEDSSSEVVKTLMSLLGFEAVMGKDKLRKIQDEECVSANYHLSTLGAARAQSGTVQDMVHGPLGIQ
jgi:hypothetical protein